MNFDLMNVSLDGFLDFRLNPTAIRDCLWSAIGGKYEPSLLQKIYGVGGEMNVTSQNGQFHSLREFISSDAHGISFDARTYNMYMFAKNMKFCFFDYQLVTCRFCTDS
jgi:hypothetical protein